MVQGDQVVSGLVGGVALVSYLVCYVAGGVDANMMPAVSSSMVRTAMAMMNASGAVRCGGLCCVDMSAFLRDWRLPVILAYGWCGPVLVALGEASRWQWSRVGEVLCP